MSWPPSLEAGVKYSKVSEQGFKTCKKGLLIGTLLKFYLTWVSGFPKGRACTFKKPNTQAKPYQIIMLGKSHKMKHLQKWKIYSKLQTEALCKQYMKKVTMTDQGYQKQNDVCVERKWELACEELQKIKSSASDRIHNGKAI